MQLTCIATMEEHEREEFYTECDYSDLSHTAYYMSQADYPGEMDESITASLDDLHRWGEVIEFSFNRTPYYLLKCSRTRVWSLYRPTIED